MAYTGQALYRLMILYMLDKVNYPLSNSQITGFFLSSGYTDYFHVQETLKDMVCDTLLTDESHTKSTYYEMTDAGRTAFNSLKNMLDGSIAGEIDAYLRENDFKMRSDSSVRADSFLRGNGDHRVVLRLSEGDGDIFRLELDLVSKEDADKACGIFRDRSQQIYMEILKLLTGGD